MLRKITLALAAATVVATAAIPTTASAIPPNDIGWRHHHRHHHHHYGAYYSYGFARHCYTSKRFVRTYWGWRPVFVRRCY